MSEFNFEALFAEHGITRESLRVLPGGDCFFEIPVLPANLAALELAYEVLSYKWLQWVLAHPVTLVLSQGSIAVGFRANPQDVDLIQYLFNEVKGARTLFI